MTTLRIMTEIFDDIKTRYVFEAPCRELGNFIEYYWESSSDGRCGASGSAPFTMKLFRSWTPTLSFNLGSPYEVILGKDRFVLDAKSDVLHFRSTTSAYKYDTGNHKFGVKFFPGTLGAVLNLDPKLYDEKLVPLKQVLPPVLITKVKTAASFPERVALLQDYFLTCYHRIAGTKHSLQLVRDAIQYQYRSLTSKNQEIAAGIFTTRKTLYRNFTAVIGASPKEYFSVVRARTALNTYIKHRKSFDPTDFGYYDWSHFHKAVFRLVGRKLFEEGA